MEGVEIIAPPQYSVAWAILACLCLIVAVGLTVVMVKLTRWLVERKAHAHRPGDLDALKADFLLEVSQVALDVKESRATAREGHRALESILRMFVMRTSGLDVRNTSLVDLINDPRTRQVGLVIARFHEPGFARESQIELSESIHRTREVIRSWS